MKGSGISFAKRGKQARGLTPLAENGPNNAGKRAAKRRPDPVTPEHADSQARRDEALAASMLIPTPPTLGPRGPACLDGAGGFGDWGFDDAFGGGLDAGLFPLSEEDDLLAVGEDLASSGATSRTMGAQISQTTFFDEEFLQTTRGMLAADEDDLLESQQPSPDGTDAPSTPTLDSSSRGAGAGAPEPDVDVAPQAAAHETPACKRFEAMALHPSRTFFHISEMLAAADDKPDPPADTSNSNSTSTGVRFELFARVAHSARENFGHRQYFRLRDLLADDAPHVPGLLAGWDAGGAVDCAAREFLAPLAEGQLGRKCYCVGELRADLVGGAGKGAKGVARAVLVREIRPVLWRDIRGAMGVLGRDDLDSWVC